MYEIFDKIVLFLCCLILYIFYADSSYLIVPVILAVVFSCLFIYYENLKIRSAGTLLYVVLCFFFPSYIIFLPLLCYDILHSKYQYIALLLPCLILFHTSNYSIFVTVSTVALLMISFLLKHKADRLNKLKVDYNDLRDSTTVMSFQLNRKNQELLKNQDYEINLATLNERNRISKEIHDNIGHLLSRSLLQVGALLTISGEGPVEEGLSSLKSSLSEGMDQIRNSIHNMYDESIDLYAQIEQLVKDFTFCPISFDYDIKTPPPIQLKLSLIAITKESLSNIIRHSNATMVQLKLREHPAMYQLVIKDNGTLEDPERTVLTKAFENLDFNEGMGLKNIYDRVKSFGGNIHLSLDNGFQIFITIPSSLL